MEPAEPQDDEILTIAQFAAKVHLKPKAIYKRIRLNKLPPGTLVDRLGRYGINYTVFKRSIRTLN
jgi:hypothetical protein